MSAGEQIDGRAAVPRRPASHEGRGIRDQIRRYRGSFLAILGMVAIGVLAAGYVLASERLNPPCGFPLIGKCYFRLGAYLRTAQALTPGQGQAVTIAGAKVGELEAVELRHGRALIWMSVQPKFARLYADATVVVRPKTPLEDMTVEINPGASPARRLRSGAVLPISQTTPNVHFDQFLEELDAETRADLQALLAAAAEGLEGNGAQLAAVFRRFPALSRNGEQITRELSLYHANIARGLHSFAVLLQALGEVEKQIRELVLSENGVFRTFAAQQHNVERTLHLLPGALAKTQHGLGKLAVAFDLLGPTLAKLHPTAVELAPAERAQQQSAKATTPIIASQIRPFARQAEPVLVRLQPAASGFARALPQLTSAFTTLNQIVNELAYNPGSGQASFLFYGAWDAHNSNSTYATADANGALGNGLLYFKCDFLNVIEKVAPIDATAKLLVGLLGLPHCSKPEVEAAERGIPVATTAAAGASRAGRGG